jgi:glycosyltransferase involved in cell wall biosynthesis
MERYRLSVAMCTYNGARFLREQLESIAAQRRVPDEMVICDDRSTDKSVEILKNFAQRAPFPVSVQLNESNLGSTRNFEKAICACNGEIIALADQDDVWYPSKLERIEAVFMSRPSVGIVFSDADVIGADHNLLGFRLWQSVNFSAAQRKSISNGRSTEALLTRNVVTGSTMVFRAQYRDLTLPIPKSWVHDEWIALLVSAVSDLAAVDEPLIGYRKHPEQQIGPLDFTLTELYAHAKKRGAGEFRDLAQQYTLARDRLLAAGAGPRLQAAISGLETKIEHLLARSQMNSKRLPRLPQIFDELRSRRYHRYSNGWRSAVKDLLF